MNTNHPHSPPNKRDSKPWATYKPNNNIKKKPTLEEVLTKSISNNKNICIPKYYKDHPNLNNNLPKISKPTKCKRLDKYDPRIKVWQLLILLILIIIIFFIVYKRNR